MPGILIAEDDWLIAENLRIVLESMGYAIVGIATNGEDAIKMASKTKPHAMLFDISLPGEINGIQAAASIRKLHSSSIPVIFITGYPLTSPSDLEAPVHVVQKPWNDQILKKLIQQLVPMGE